jgi:hypothetical protein
MAFYFGVDIFEGFFGHQFGHRPGHHNQNLTPATSAGFSLL